MQKIQHTKVQTNSNICDRFERAILYLIRVLFFMLVILFIQIMMTISNHPILIGAELAGKYRNSAVKQIMTQNELDCIQLVINLSLSGWLMNEKMSRINCSVTA